MNEYQVFFQREEDAVVTNAQAVSALLAGQLLNIPAKILLECVQLLSDPPALLPGKARSCPSASSLKSNR